MLGSKDTIIQNQPTDAAVVILVPATDTALLFCNFPSFSLEKIGKLFQLYSRSFIPPLQQPYWITSLQNHQVTQHPLWLCLNSMMNANRMCAIGVSTWMVFSTKFALLLSLIYRITGKLIGHGDATLQGIANTLPQGSPGLPSALSSCAGYTGSMVSPLDVGTRFCKA